MQASLSADKLRHLIEAARGSRPCDLVLRGGWVVNVFTGETLRADIGVSQGYIAVVSSNDSGVEAERVVDVENLFITPGLIDAHVHLESSLLSPAEFARAVAPLGTTAVVLDPHEVANVAGADGIRALMAVSANLPLTIYFTIPPAVPASNLETSGAVLTCDDIAGLADDPRVVGLAEEMDVVGVLEARGDVLAKLTAMRGKPVDGHAPGLSGRDLQAYVSAGIDSDHECTNSWEGFERLQAGMYLMIREGSVARNLDDLISLANPNTASRCVLITDDLLPTDLEDRGHINYLLSRAVRHGVSAPQAIRMVTLNAAQRLRLNRVGAVAPGYKADITAFEDLSDFRAATVVAKGEVVAMDGELVTGIPVRESLRATTSSVILPRLEIDDIRIRAGRGSARVIGAENGSILTKCLTLEPAVLSGHVVSDVDRDILKIVLVERHGRNGNVAVGLAHGFGLRSGALASSVAHDAHNVIAVGASDADILLAIETVGATGGGLVAAVEGKVVANLPLPVYGLMSRLPASTVAKNLRHIEQVAHQLGCPMRHPFMTLSFMSLSVVPELKITDKGLVDATRHEIVPLFIEGGAEAERPAAG